MSKFHEPVLPEEGIFLKRKQRYLDVTKACYRGVFFRILIILAEFIGYYFTKSQALLVDAIATTLDICFSFFLIASIRYASKPPDENHPFGHGRFEPIAGFQLSLVLVASGLYLCFNELMGSINQELKQFPLYSFLIPLFSAVILEGCFQYFRKTAKKSHSSALLADAYHIRSDALSSVIASLSLVFALIFPSMGSTLDHIGAFFIAFLMVLTGVGSLKENLFQLLDKRPSDSYLEVIKNAANSIKGVLGTEKLRVMRYGPDAHVDIDIEVDPELSVMKAHRIAQHVRAKIQDTCPEVQDVMVHIEPYFEGDH